ncbi:hypothetical protein BCR37DRAFT_385440 [Protomyces lactucae-debilis]|uniref:Uncharacterized protein n=1 Tax=Protomyces lactucae-debilis TaxID=2754530 RepID=A0A1Y2FSL8_PROLT|nr:uncharacterized protein BCR37DRAFT_385440 [Protomyces lactucae-debilis]ORY87002.1 hypothetical protein BCR37DRAFT_385440 [Protomyces lactucae-debilis]
MPFKIQHFQRPPVAKAEEQQGSKFLANDSSLGRVPGEASYHFIYRQEVESSTSESVPKIPPGDDNVTHLPFVAIRKPPAEHAVPSIPQGPTVVSASSRLVKHEQMQLLDDAGRTLHEGQQHSSTPSYRHDANGHEDEETSTAQMTSYDVKPQRPEHAILTVSGRDLQQLRHSTAANASQFALDGLSEARHDQRGDYEERDEDVQNDDGFGFAMPCAAENALDQIPCITNEQGEPVNLSEVNVCEKLFGPEGDQLGPTLLSEWQQVLRQVEGSQRVCDKVAEGSLDQSKPLLFTLQGEQLISPQSPGSECFDEEGKLVELSSEDVQRVEQKLSAGKDTGMHGNKLILGNHEQIRDLEHEATAGEGPEDSEVAGSA